MTEPTVTITEKEYNKLLDSAFKLQCLENGGVDNWEWYSEALEPYWEEVEQKREDFILTSMGR